MNFIVKETKKELYVLKDANGNFCIKERIFNIPIETMFPSESLANEFIKNKEYQIKNDTFHSDLYVISTKYFFEVKKIEINNKPEQKNQPQPVQSQPVQQVPLVNTPIPQKIESVPQIIQPTNQPQLQPSPQPTPQIKIEELEPSP
jgi:hypothetical protein